MNSKIFMRVSFVIIMISINWFVWTFAGMTSAETEIWLSKNSLLNNANQIIAIIGVWLSSVGVIGKNRLEKWDKNLHLIFTKDKNDDGVSFENDPFLSTILFTFLGAFSIIYVIGYFRIDLLDHPWGTKLFAFIAGNLFLIMLVLFSELLRGLIYLPLLLIMFLLYLPYKVIGSLEEEGRLERTLTFLGALLTTIGLLLSK